MVELPPADMSYAILDGQNNPTFGQIDGILHIEQGQPAEDGKPVPQHQINRSFVMDEFGEPKHGAVVGQANPVIALGEEQDAASITSSRPRSIKSTKSAGGGSRSGSVRGDMADPYAHSISDNSDNGSQQEQDKQSSEWAFIIHLSIYLFISKCLS